MKRQYSLLARTALASAALILVIQSSAFAVDDTFKPDGGMTWPMLPHESIGELSIKFYPDNAVMQQRFIAKTLQLNKESLPTLDQKTRFTASTAILIPNLKSLSSGTKAIKFRSKTVKHQTLHMSYNIQSTLEALPQALIDEYEQLLARNEALKTEIAKLNDRLIYLQNKLDSLMQVLQKIITFHKQSSQPLPESPVIKPENTGNIKPQPDGALVEAVKPIEPAKPDEASKLLQPAPTPVQAVPDKKPAVSALPQNTSDAAQTTLWTYFSDWLIVVLLLLVAFFGIQFLSRKRQQKAIAFLTADSIMPKPIKIDQAFDEIEVPDIEAELAMPSSTQVDEYKERSILEEAKMLVQNGAIDEAISHIKWSIRAQPKTAIGVWLYLLAQLRTQNLKEDFERYAFEMHQTFNVMTPLWNNQKPQDIVIAESVENFKHIAKEIIKLWPTEPCKQYLQSLITDNRNGERLGFSQEVVDEILFLIELQDVRLQLDEFPVSI